MYAYSTGQYHWIITAVHSVNMYYNEIIKAFKTI